MDRGQFRPLYRGRQVDAYIRGVEAICITQLARDLAKMLICCPKFGVACHTQHPAGGGVVRGEERFPIGEMLPAFGVEKLIARLH